MVLCRVRRATPCVFVCLCLSGWLIVCVFVSLPALNNLVVWLFVSLFDCLGAVKCACLLVCVSACLLV